MCNGKKKINFKQKVWWRKRYFSRFGFIFFVHRTKFVKDKLTFPKDNYLFYINKSLEIIVVFSQLNQTNIRNKKNWFQILENVIGIITSFSPEIKMNVSFISTVSLSLCLFFSFPPPAV